MYSIRKAADSFPGWRFHQPVLQKLPVHFLTHAAALLDPLSMTVGKLVSGHDRGGPGQRPRGQQRTLVGAALPLRAPAVYGVAFQERKAWRQPLTAQRVWPGVYRCPSHALMSAVLGGCWGDSYPASRESTVSGWVLKSSQILQLRAAKLH